MRALCGLALALCASASAAGDYEWPVVRVIDGATLVVDAGADFPPELAALTVRLRGGGRRGGAGGGVEGRHPQPAARRAGLRMPGRRRRGH